MRIQRYIVNKNKLVLVPFGDLHWGHRNCDKDMAHNVIKYIHSNDCYWFGGGDYGDAIIPIDRRFDFRSMDKEYKTPQEQYNKVEELFRPISKKCLGFLDGNHDIIHWKMHAHNYVEDLSRRLDVPYLTIDAYMRFYFKKYRVNFDLYTHHGWTGARTKGGKINRIYDLEAIFPMLDAYIMFHIHDLGIVDKKANLYVDSNMEIRDKISYFIMGGGFLRGYVKDQVSYIEEKTYRPSVLGSPILTIEPIRGKKTVNFKVEYSEVR